MLTTTVDHILAVLRDIQERGITVFLRYRNRRFNKVAEALTRKARAEKQAPLKFVCGNLKTTWSTALSAKIVGVDSARVAST